MTVKEIHIGNLIRLKVQEQNIQFPRMCNFLKCSEEDILKMFDNRSCDTYLLLRWSKLLEYDFFRIYSSHLILFSPCTNKPSKKNEKTIPDFRKNIYTQEVKDFILEKIEKKVMTASEVIFKYNIPKTTLFTWIRKSKIEE